MALAVTRSTTVPAVPAADPAREKAPTWDETLCRIHHHFVEQLDLQRVARMDPAQLRREARAPLEKLCEQENLPLTRAERERLVEQVLDETFGYGPLEALLKDTTISDIMVNGPNNIFIERRGKLERTGVTFRDNKHLMQVIDRIVSKVGRRVDETCPMADARLPDGSRVNVIIPPLALDGPTMSIRRFGRAPLRIAQLLEIKSITPEMVEFLEACIQARLNVLISGGTGSGKTTFLNVLSGYIPNSQRVVTIEDAAELQLQQDHVVRLETRPPNIEGKGEVTSRDLVRNALRMRPDRIIIGEVRGAEALDMLQAMNTGHDGSLTTIHANSPRDALSRVETMVMMAGLDLPISAMRHQIASAIDVVVQTQRLQGGPRRVTDISEILNVEQETIVMQSIFHYRQVGIDGQGQAYGEFIATGILPHCVPRLVAAGIKLPDDMFGERRLMADHDETPVLVRSDSGRLRWRQRP